MLLFFCRLTLSLLVVLDDIADLVSVDFILMRIFLMLITCYYRPVVVTVEHLVMAILLLFLLIFVVLVLV